VLCLLRACWRRGACCPLPGWLLASVVRPPCCRSGRWRPALPIMPTDPAWAWKVVKLSRARDLPPADVVRAFAISELTITNVGKSQSM
jgi:hypothetical protein